MSVSCNFLTVSSCSNSSAVMVWGMGTVLDFFPFPSWMLRMPSSKLKFCTRSLRHSKRRSPQPYSILTTRSYGYERCFNTVSISRLERTTGIYFDFFARGTSLWSPKSFFSICRYKNNNELKAWFCVEAETVHFTARYVRYALTSVDDNSSGGLLCRKP